MDRDFFDAISALIFIVAVSLSVLVYSYATAEKPTQSDQRLQEFSDEELAQLEACYKIKNMHDQIACSLKVGE